MDKAVCVGGGAVGDKVYGKSPPAPQFFWELKIGLPKCLFIEAF